MPPRSASSPDGHCLRSMRWARCWLDRVPRVAHLPPPLPRQCSPGRLSLRARARRGGSRGPHGGRAARACGCAPRAPPFRMEGRVRGTGLGGWPGASSSSRRTSAASSCRCRSRRGAGGEHGPVTVLYRPARQAWLAELMRTARDRPESGQCPPLSGVRQMIKALRRGGGRGLCPGPGAARPKRQGLWAPFFGLPAYTMTLAARLVQQTGATVVLARCERPPARPRTAALSPWPSRFPLPSKPPSCGQRQSMERIIRHSPDQYLWNTGATKPRAEASTPAVPGADA